MSTSGFGSYGDWQTPNALGSQSLSPNISNGIKMSTAASPLQLLGRFHTSKALSRAPTPVL